MAIESFLPTTDAKKTIEKSVKEKPKATDLVTVERPGKSMPASNLEEKPRKKTSRRRRKKSTTSERATTIHQPKRDSILIITEKPQAAQKIAHALSGGRAVKRSEQHVPFYELARGENKIIVASAVGHLFNLTYVKGQRGYPIFKTEWVPSFNQKTAAFTKKYYSVLKKLSKRAKEFIVATDYDVEGEVIGWNVLRFIAKKNDAKRMKYSTLTKAELEQAYENMMPTLDWGQAYAGETRHRIDWLYGINLSRALMAAIKRTGSFKILSIGRVQGPALKIIVDRDKEIASFKPKPYWQVLAHIDWNAAGLKEPEGGCPFKHPKDIFDKSELDAFNTIKDGIASTAEKEEVLRPPTPFDLTTLQREAHAKHRITPSNTLKIAQSLYLAGLISYPRTSSQKIPDQIKPRQILKRLERRFSEAVALATRSKPIEGRKSDPAHPSIYPTGDSPTKKLSADEEKIYELVVRRFISCFCPDAKTANKKITITPTVMKDKLFIAKGLVVTDKGWTCVYPTRFDERTLPTINGPVTVIKIEFPEKETQPPKRYTAASLVSLLERKNLGTKATRSAIVDTLFNRGYLDGKSIESTPLGKQLIGALEKYSSIIIDENLTRNVEEKMEELLQSKKGFEDKEQQIISNVERIITDIAKDFKIREVDIGNELLKGTEALRERQRADSTLMQCSVCKKGNLAIRYSKKISRYFVACDAYPACKTTYSLPPNAMIRKTDKISERGLPMLLAIRKGKRPWEFEFNPNWKAERDKGKS